MYKVTTEQVNLSIVHLIEVVFRNHISKEKQSSTLIEEDLEQNFVSINKQG